eukprot:21744_1
MVFKAAWSPCFVISEYFCPIFKILMYMLPTSSSAAWGCNSGAVSALWPVRVLYPQKLNMRKPTSSTEATIRRSKRRRRSGGIECRSIMCESMLFVEPSITCKHVLWSTRSIPVMSFSVFPI